MAEVFVVFPPQGAPKVTPEVQHAENGNRIFWDIVSCNPNVNYVIVEFEDKDAKFFDNGREPHRAWRPVKDGKTCIPGEVRYNGAKEPRKPVWGKYSIIGCERLKNEEPDGATWVLDPVIVTGDPG